MSKKTSLLKAPHFLGDAPLEWRVDDSTNVKANQLVAEVKAADGKDIQIAAWAPGKLVHKKQHGASIGSEEHIGHIELIEPPQAQLAPTSTTQENTVSPLRVAAVPSPTTKSGETLTPAPNVTPLPEHITVNDASRVLAEIKAHVDQIKNLRLEAQQAADAIKKREAEWASFGERLVIFASSITAVQDRMVTLQGELAQLRETEFARVAEERNQLDEDESALLKAMQQFRLRQ